MSKQVLLYLIAELEDAVINSGPATETAKQLVGLLRKYRMELHK